MLAFRCRVCDNQLFFENSLCVACGTALGFSREERAIVPVDDAGRYVDEDGLVWWVCRNLNLSGCTWLARLEGGQCFACDLTRTRPSDDDTVGLVNFHDAEQAKRHLVVELDTLGFPILTKAEDELNGLCFDLLSSVAENVTIGHADGVITIDLAESDDAYREKIRAKLDEPYRTMLGHFRHEVGHYYEWQLVQGDLIGSARELFGDESESYADALERHYEEGAPAGWEESFISTYATMHPFEDFAETFAHYLHICDTIESAREYGVWGSGPLPGSFPRLISEVWVPLTTALNVINRSMGREDLYPFVIPPPVVDKLDFVATLPR
ncbi:putative zinc-binding metallopeptidase [Nocardioides sp.]|uniref:zinc-binding metallopeptidase family protein n=1 Tax=Nocardioides sp. TaxID=35761 RepID=UPI0039E4658E